MELENLLKPEGIIPKLRASSKKQALQDLATRAAEITGLSDRDIFDILLEREKLGSTGVGHGIAIPHGKLPQLECLHGLFAKLDEPVGFDSLDDQPVDLIFLLLAPESAGADHLKALAKISRLLRNEETREKLRRIEEADAIYAVLTEPVVNSH